MFDKKLLQAAMDAHGDRHSDLAAALGVSPQNFSVIWNGRQEFRRSHIIVIAVRYQLDPFSVWNIFLKDDAEKLKGQEA